MRVTVLAVAAALAVASLVPAGAAQSLPTRISDGEFWTMMTAFSEPGGSFVSDNIISNEIAFQSVIPHLQEKQFQDVYLGVGPEQNFTYITALRPRLAFIIDIRRQNQLLHLAYKAMVELSPDRVGFLSRLFARAAPPGLPADATPRALFEAFAAVPPSEDLARDALRAVLDQLTRVHHFPLTSEDERGIAETYRTIYRGGPNLRGEFGGGPWIPSFAQLMAATDLNGRNHGFLASEQNFLVLKEYEAGNLIVPIVGDFGGDLAIHAIGEYLKERRAMVTTFYVSNVEEYLFKDDTWRAFAANVLALPINNSSMFIRTYYTHTTAGMRTLLDSMPGLLNAFAGGRIQSYSDVVLRSKSPT